MFKFTLLKSEYFGRIDRGFARVSCKDLETDRTNVYQFFFSHTSGTWEFYYKPKNMPNDEFLRDEMEKWFIQG